MSEFVYDMKYIIVKRSCNGNKQLINEVECYSKLENSKYLDLLNPIMKHFTTKSDHGRTLTQLENVLVVAQKPKLSELNYRQACLMAEYMNVKEGLVGENASDRMRKFQSLNAYLGWHGILNINNTNCGVIYDYHQQCYKAVLVRYTMGGCK